jgi:hypothetical protein
LDARWSNNAQFGLDESAGISAEHEDSGTRPYTTLSHYFYILRDRGAV